MGAHRWGAGSSLPKALGDKCLPTPTQPDQTSADLREQQSILDIAQASPALMRRSFYESPVQLLLKAAPGGDGQRADELSEIDGAIPVLVEGAEGVLGKLGGISVWEELQSRTHKVTCQEGKNRRPRSESPLPHVGPGLSQPSQEVRGSGLPMWTRFGPTLKAKDGHKEAVSPCVLTPRLLALA